MTITFYRNNEPVGVINPHNGHSPFELDMATGKITRLSISHNRIDKEPGKLYCFALREETAKKRFGVMISQLKHFTEKFHELPTDNH